MKNKANTKLRHTMYKIFFITKLVLSIIVILLMIFSMVYSPWFLPELFNSFRLNWPSDGVKQRTIMFVYILFMTIILVVYIWWLITVIRKYQQLTNEYKNSEGEQTNE